MRGRMKRERLDTKIIAIGDEVLWTPAEEGTGIIEEVLPRRSVLSRQAPPPRTRRARGGYTPPEQHTEQVLMANPDQVLVVFSLRNPSPNPLMLDRYLVACEAVELPVVMVANKVDLVEEDEDLDIVRLYQIWATVLPAASRRARLRRFTRRWAPALGAHALGVGKSCSERVAQLDLETGEVSA